MYATKQKSIIERKGSAIGKNFEGGVEEVTLEKLENVQRSDKSTLYTFGLAMFLHSVIEGLAIGVFERTDDLFVLVLSIIIHKIPVALTVGTTFLSNG